MEAFAAIGLSSNILQFIEITKSLISAAREIYDNGAKKENLEVEKIAQRFRALAQGIISQHLDPVNASSTDEDFRGLCDDCISITDRLLPVLESLKLGEGMDGWKSGHRALRAWWKSAEVNGLQTRLDRIGQALTQHLIASQQASIARKLHELAVENNRLEGKRTEDIKSLQDQLRVAFDKLATDSTRGQIEPESLPFPLLLAITGKGYRYSAEQLILHKFRYDGIDDRYQGVHSAHEKTFSWVWEPTNDPEDPTLSSSFKYWLTSGNQLFWISGKPGSGKSTIMKYLCEHKNTRRELEKWAGRNLLITGNFFFWNAAKRSILKSQEGLLRSLIYQVLCKSPETIAHIYPEIGHMEALGESGQVSTQDGRTTDLRGGAPTSIPGLLSTLREICESPTLSTTRLCFFIDGLDEYEGRPADIIQLIDILGSIPNLKLCISSRPWNEFEQRFGQDRPEKLYMELLNKEDIGQYVHDIFMGESNYRALVDEGGEGADLIREIIEASQGVFLWVVLVVRSFRDGLINGDRIEDLRVRLGLLPRDLNQYFDKILLSDVDEFYRPEASRMFKATVSAHIQLPLMAYWFIGNKSDNYGFEPGLVPLNPHQFNTRKAQLRKILNARTKGLLEVREGDYTCNDKGGIFTEPLLTVDFLHRTVRDFLVTPDTQNWLHQWDDGTFDTDMAICHALMAQLKTTPRLSGEGDILSFGKASDLFSLFFHHAEALDHNPDCDVNMLERLLQQFDDALFSFDRHETRRWYKYELELIIHDIADPLIPFRANTVRLTLLGIKYGLYRYVARSLDSDPTRRPPGEYLPVFLRYAVIEGRYRIDNHQMEHMLLERGISPNEKVNKDDMDGGNWERLLYDIWDLPTLSSAQIHYFTQMCIQFLEFGANRDLIVRGNLFAEPSEQVTVSCFDILKVRLSVESLALIQHYFPDGTFLKQVLADKPNWWKRWTVREKFENMRNKKKQARQVTST